VGQNVNVVYSVLSVYM